MKIRWQNFLNSKFFFGTVLWALIGFISATRARADVLVFTNRLSWEQAAGGGTGNILDDLNSGTLNRGSYVISGSAVAAFPNSNAQTTIDGTGYLRSLLSGSSANDTLFTFQTAILALGFDVNPQNFNLGATVNFSVDGTPAGSYALPATDVNGFIGILSDTPFTTLDTTTSDANAWHGIDNLEAYSVPEPSDLALLLSAFAGICWMHRRRTSRC